MIYTRREVLRTALIALPGLLTASGIAATACARAGNSEETDAGTVAAGSVDTGHAAPEARVEPVAKLDRPKEAWRELLPRDRYDVLFEEDTERPFSSPLNDEKRTGTFVCAACYLPLFESSTKFDSGTGWPSFYRPIAGRIGKETDYKLVFPRTEYHCARCGGHQGHVFKDGPPPTGERWCNNGLALKFVPEGEALPELRP